MTTPSVRNVGNATAGSTTFPLSVTLPTFAAGDLCMIFVEHATGAATNHVTATGWTEVAFASQGAPQ